MDCINYISIITKVSQAQPLSINFPLACTVSEDKDLILGK